MFPLIVRDAVSRRRGKTLVGPVDLDWDGQGACVVLGPNGSGKTTLLRMLHGIARLNSGQISWACDMTTARNAQSFVFQRPVMLRRSVHENLIYPLILRGVSAKVARDEAANWAQRVGLAHMLNRSAQVLSGGEQQKLALTRALISKPELVFLDEPSASLDGRATREIEEILAQCKAQATSLMMATHDMGQARRLADHVVFMFKGQVHEYSTAEQFFEAPKTREARAFLEGDIVE